MKVEMGTPTYWQLLGLKKCFFQKEMGKQQISLTYGGVFPLLFGKNNRLTNKLFWLYILNYSVLL